MLYLEDYLEMIENLPMEMRDRFTEMREMDLQVQNALDSLEEQNKNFFHKCSVPGVKPEWKEEVFSQIKADYSKALEDADEKVQLTNQIHELVDRYLRKLDQELSKFKMELEADNAGITETLERRSLEMDIPPPTMNNHRAEKRKYASTLSNHLDKRTSTEKVLCSLAKEVVRESIGGHRATGTGGGAATPQNVSTVAPHPTATPAISYSLGHVGAGSNAAIAAAASRAIGATLEMQQGRRTSSLKASYDALTRNPDLGKELTLRAGGDARATAATSQPATPPEPPPPKASRSKKSGSRAQQQQQVQAPPPPPPVVEEIAVVEEVAEIPADDMATAAANTWAIDPNEPRYCICNDVSYGEMVGCDNEDCPIEWFHYGCVGLAQAPKGKWFCPQCTAAMKRRGRK